MNDSRPTRTVYGRGVSLDRFPLGEGIYACIAVLRETRGARRSAMSSGLDIGVQLQGSLAQRAHRGGGHVYAGGTFHVLHPGEAYDCAYDAGARASVTVWFSATESVAGSATDDRELVFTEQSPQRDRALLELAHGVYRARVDSTPLPAGACSEIQAFLRRRCTLSAPTRLATVRRELERYASHELYVGYFAEQARMHPVAFTRAFSRRYGMSPIRYRTSLRLNEAARVAWARPELSVADIAAQCGFTHLSYYYRQFASYFGTTPVVHRRNGIGQQAPVF